jgi:hypothetical protein
MPPGGDLSPGDKAKLKKFKDDGVLRECAEVGSFGTPTLDYLETYILEDILRLPPSRRLQVRYLVTAHANVLELPEAEWSAGIAKQINSVSTERSITIPQPIDPRGLVHRLDIGEYDLEVRDFDAINLFDEIQFESKTSKGLLIKSLTQTKYPWLHADNFAFITNLAPIYYFLLGIPSDFDDFLALDFIEVDLQQQYRDLEPRLIGFNGSPISIQKNRLLARYESEEGYLWVTYDVFSLENVGSNLFGNPLLEVGAKIFNFDASEVIFTLPNGLQGYALYEADGGRADFAPTDLVFDTESPLDPQIDNALDCHRCHKAGLLPATDQIKDAVRANPTQFDINDVQLVEFLYTENAAALFQKDNGTYKKALESVGTDPARDDINGMVDHFRSDYGLAKLAAFLFVSERQLKACIEQSAVLQAQIGQLTSDGTISLEQLENSFQDILKECGFNEELFYP